MEANATSPNTSSTSTQLVAPQLVLVKPGSAGLEPRYCLQGAWLTAYLQECLAWQSQADLPAALQVDIAAMDTNGALAFIQLFGTSPTGWPPGVTAKHQQLLRLVLAQQEQPPAALPKRGWLEDIGRRLTKLKVHGHELLYFIGQVSLAMFTLLTNPKRFKPKLFLDAVQKDGLYAVPLVVLLSFLLGAVIAWQGGLQLKNYGANVFIVELVALTYLRELGPLITAILVAGRSGSAYAAQLATMKINQEILALRTLGQDPFDWLVLPKLLGLLVALPLLTILADFSGLVGGSLMAAAQLDISPYLFWQRLSQQVDLSHFTFGLLKSPLFALIIVSVGCLQGMRASGGADAVGARTTTSVVQAIFLVIVADAACSVFLS